MDYNSLCEDHKILSFLCWVIERIWLHPSPDNIVSYSCCKACSLLPSFLSTIFFVCHHWNPLSRPSLSGTTCSSLVNLSCHITPGPHHRSSNFGPRNDWKWILLNLCALCISSNKIEILHLRNFVLKIRSPIDCSIIHNILTQLSGNWLNRETIFLTLHQA